MFQVWPVLFVDVASTAGSIGVMALFSSYEEQDARKIRISEGAISATVRSSE